MTYTIAVSFPICKLKSTTGASREHGPDEITATALAASTTVRHAADTTRHSARLPSCS